MTLDTSAEAMAIHITKRRSAFIEAGYSEPMADVCMLAYIDGLRQGTQFSENFLTNPLSDKAEVLRFVKLMKSDVCKCGHALMEVMKQQSKKPDLKIVKGDA